MNIVLKTREKKDDEIEIILLKNTEKLPKKTKTILNNINFKSSNFNTYFEVSSKKIFVYTKNKDSESIKIAISKAANALKKYSNFYININSLNKELNIEDLAQGFILGSYEFLNYKKKDKKQKRLCVNIKNSKEQTKNLQQKLEDCLSLCESVNFVRDIVNTPAHDFYPKSMAKEALELAQRDNMSCKVYGEDYMQENSVKEVWYDSKAFNYFRGDSWMKEPCRTCDERDKDFGGCRCQAFALTGEMNAADPVCSKSPDHAVVTQKIQDSITYSDQKIFYRNRKNSISF